MLIFLGFFTPLPLPGEEGIFVNFGTGDSGFGRVEPGSAQNSNIESTQQIQQNEIETVPIQSQPTQQPSSNTRQETVVTQDIEQTVNINAAEEAERREKQLEEERRHQLELEQQRIAEAEKTRREEQQRINEINSRTQVAFSNGGTSSGEQGSATETSEGITFPEGNQGLTTNDSNTGNYGQISGGLGVSFSLAGRSAISLPKPNYPGNDEGVVVVNVTVDKNGNVTTAEPGVRGTNIMNRQFWVEARQAALKTKFSINENAPVQQGTITYRFSFRPD